MEIRGPDLSSYDARHISAVHREMARSIKPNVLRELDEEKIRAFLTTGDTVSLSPEALAYLKELRRRLKAEGRPLGFATPTQEDFEALLEGLEALKRQVEEEALKNEPPARPAFPRTITLSRYQEGERSKPRSSPVSAARELLEGMIVYAPSAEVRELVKRELEVLGEGPIRQVKQFGVRIIVLDRRLGLHQLKIQGMFVVGPGERTFDGRPWEAVRGLYDQSRRLLVLGEEMVGSPFRSVARHEFAHAYDHMFTEKHRRRLPLSVQLWNSFRGQRQGLVSTYAGTNPAEYFAESVEAFFQEGGREKLRQGDPQMFGYLQELFASA
ncbi:MAG TPA: zinc-dependent peptidase [Candidatus Nitrosotenuis sp.]|jgi:hypothetical protein|nr:zinc-dependent peptidase [Candidatus Nitrosotenuis sp.]